jgi:hypothetical protein
MSASQIFRFIVVVAGICLMLLTFYMYSRRRLTDSIAMGWMLYALGIILAGAIRAWSGWSRALALASYPMVFLLAGLITLIMFWLSVHLSLQIMKTQELAMHVSLLNQENEQMIQELHSMEKRLAELENGAEHEAAKKDSFCA